MLALLLTSIVAAPQSQYAANFPRVLLPYENSVCRVTTDDGGSSSHGSGVLLKAPGGRTNEYVLTAYHVVSDRNRSRPVMCTWDGNTQYKFTVVAARPGCDAAILMLMNGQTIPSDVPRVPIAASEITLGEVAYGFGFGSTSDNRLRCSGGTVFEFTSNTHRDPVWFGFAGRFRQGDSGGPVFVVRDGRGVLVGIGWGTGQERAGHWGISATRLRVIHRLFGLEKAPANPSQGRGSNRVIVGSGSS